jgi:hypothetical protein
VARAPIHPPHHHHDRSGIGAHPGGDPGPVDAVFASQALALDTLFTQLTRQAVEDGWLSRDTFALALKAQLQSRATLKRLASPIMPPGDGRANIQSTPAPVGSDAAQKRNSSEQTIESSNP